MIHSPNTCDPLESAILNIDILGDIMPFIRVPIGLALLGFGILVSAPIFAQSGRSGFSGQRQWVVVKSSLHDFTFTSDDNVADFDSEKAAQAYAYQLNKATPPTDLGNYVYLTHERGTWGTSNNPFVKSRGPADASQTPDQRAADLNNRLKQLQISTTHTFRDVLKEKSHDVDAVKERVDKLSKYLTETVPTLTNDAFKDVNGLIGEYNAMAKQLGASGPGGLQPIAPLDAKAFGSLSSKMQKEAAQEQVLNVKARLEDADLRLKERDMNQAKEELELAAQQIAADKADGLDVSLRERQLTEAIGTYDSMKNQFQNEVDTYEHDRKRLEAVRARIREEKQLAERIRLEEEKRQRDAEGLAQRRKRLEEPKVLERPEEQKRRQQQTAPPTRLAGSQWEDDTDGIWRFDANGRAYLTLKNGSKGFAYFSWIQSGNNVSVTNPNGFKLFDVQINGDKMSGTGYKSTRSGVTETYKKVMTLVK
jgi:hypothetical protein